MSATKVLTLKLAVEKNDIEAVRDYLKQNKDSRTFKPLMLLALINNCTEIIKLFLEHGTDVDSIFIEKIFSTKSSQYANELVFHILKYHKNNIKLMKNIFYELIEYAHEGLSALDTLKLLLDHGLPVNGLVLSSKFSNTYETLLIHSIAKNRIDIVSLLLQRGAKVYKKKSDGKTPLALAAGYYRNPPMVEVLLKNGANVNQIGKYGETALHTATLDCIYITPEDKEILLLLIKYGADVNISDFDGRTPLKDASKGYEEIMVKELARLTFENQLICLKNLKHLRRNMELGKVFNDCLYELCKMKDLKFYHDISLYDILKMQKQRKKLTFLTRNKDVCAAYVKLSEYYETFFGHYFHLGDIFNEALKRKNILESEEEKLKSVFKDYKLPELVIRKVAYLVHEDLFFH